MGKRGPKSNPDLFRKQRGIRFSTPEWDKVKQNAEKANKPVSTFVRDRSLEEEDALWPSTTVKIR
tara:strand:- start:127 stop:321 length:195 start_codon:yes stop_codon:yes gene_type:complete